MRYGFLTFGPINNAYYIRALGLGKALLDRGVEVVYILSDIPENKNVVDERAELAFVKHSYTIQSFLRRRAIIRKRKLDFLEIFNDYVGASWLSVFALFSCSRLVGFWDEAAIFKTMPWWFRQWVRYRDHWFIKNTVLRVTSTREHQRLWEQEHSEPVMYMPHACYLEAVQAKLSPYATNTFVYMGSFVKEFDADLLFEAILLLKKEGIAPSVYLMGTGPDILYWKKFVKIHGLDNVVFAGYVTGEERYNRLRFAHALLFPMRATVFNKTRCPSKTLAYAQVRRPIITNRVGEIAEMLEGKAIYVEPTPEGFAQAIREAMNNISLPDVDYHVENHTWALRAEQLLKALRG